VALTGREPPISDYGFIGDTRTAGLVSSGGAIDWLCLPRFDAEPVFARLIGGPEAGTFRVGPAERYEVARRRYHPGPTSLETTWRTDGSEVVAVDAMVSETRRAALPATVLVRRVEVRGQPAPVEVVLDPVRSRRDRPRWSRRAGALVGSWGDLASLCAATPARSWFPASPPASSSSPAGRSPSSSPPPTASPWSTSPLPLAGGRSRSPSAGGGSGQEEAATTGPTGTKWCAAWSPSSC
jgi:hypothetical protein